MALESAISALGGDSGASGGVSMRVSPAEQAGRDQTRLRILQTESADPANAGDTALQRELSTEQAKQWRQPANDTGPLSGVIQVLSGGGDAEHIPRETSIADQIPGTVAAPAPESKMSVIDKIKGIGEAGLSIGTRAIAAPIGAVAGIVKGVTGGKYGTTEGSFMAQARAKEVMDSLTYRPRTEAGKEAMEGVSSALETSKLAGMGPTEAITLGAIMAGPAKVAPRSPANIGSVEAAAAPSVFNMDIPPATRARMAARQAETAPPASVTPPVTASAKAVPGQMASVGAAGTHPYDVARASVSNSSPEMQAVVENAIKKNLPINQTVLDRHIEADSLPVKVYMTEGQATGDAVKISHEQNSRAGKEAYSRRFNEQNQQLTDNTNAIRELAAPDVYETAKPDIGNIIIKSYETKDAAANAIISKNYQALKDANGGQFPLDVKAFVKAADAELHKELLFDHVPPGLRSTLNRLDESGSMTFENFESLRTITARIQRSPTVDGNVKAAAGVIRDALEAMPMTPEAAQLKPLADIARSSAKARFDLIKADPAYAAVTNGKASADKFINDHVIRADLKHVQRMKDNLAHDPVAQQAIAAGTIDHLKQRAGLVDNTGNFTQNGYNKALDAIRPKLSTIFTPEQAKQVQTLGNVARYTQQQPRGSFVNASNTAVVLMAEAAKSSAEGAANVAAHGIPIGTWARKMAANIQDAKDLKRTLQTGAGISLKDVAK